MAQNKVAFPHVLACVLRDGQCTRDQALQMKPLALEYHAASQAGTASEVAKDLLKRLIMLVGKPRVQNAMMALKDAQAKQAAAAAASSAATLQAHAASQPQQTAQPPPPAQPQPQPPPQLPPEAAAQSSQQQPAPQPMQPTASGQGVTGQKHELDTAMGPRCAWRASLRGDWAALTPRLPRRALRPTRRCAQRQASARRPRRDVHGRGSCACGHERRAARTGRSRAARRARPEAWAQGRRRRQRGG